MNKKLVLIKNNTKGKLPSLPFVAIKDRILGKNYELSIFCAGKTLARKINKERRGKDYVPNILSFSISKSSGEIIFELNEVKREAPEFDMSYKEFTKFLFIHGLLHLKGFDHGKKMESLEKKYLKLF